MEFERVENKAAAGVIETRDSPGRSCAEIEASPGRKSCRRGLLFLPGPPCVSGAGAPHCESLTAGELEITPAAASLFAGGIDASVRR